MDIELLNYIITPVLGAMAGYITNDYAINMLFKSYTPLKLGGIIPKTREEFIENVSILIEQELITSDKIDEIINEDAFKNSFNQIVEEFFDTGIIEVIGSEKTLGDIPSFCADLDNIMNSNKDMLSTEIKTIYKNNIKPIGTLDILSKSQINSICTNTYDTITENLMSSNIINLDKAINAIYPDDDELRKISNSLVKNTKISEIIKTAFKNNLNEIVSDLHYDKSQVKLLIKDKIFEMENDILVLSKSLNTDFSNLIIKSFDSAQKKSSKAMLYNMAKPTVEKGVSNIILSDLISRYITEENVNNIADSLADKIDAYIDNISVETFENSNADGANSTDRATDANGSDGIDNFLNLDLDELLTSFLEKELFKKNEIAIKKLISESTDLNVRKLLKKNKEKFCAIASDKIEELLIGKEIGDIIDADKVSDISISAIEGFIQKLKKEKIYNIISKISESENAYKTISDKAIDLLSKNLTPLLQNFIRNLVMTNFNKLNDEELCEMAKGFMGNNLKPLMYFGGGLGFIAGIILTQYSMNPNILTDVSLSSILTYSFVGFLTNAIAITMLFRPYKPIKVLSKMPVFKHFSVGYIPKHKNIMAESMSSSIDKYLLSKKSINELFDIYEDSIKEKMTSILNEDDYKVIFSFVEKNRYQIIDFSYNHLLVILNDDKNVEKLTNTLASKSISSFRIADEKKISNLLKDKMLNKFSDMIKSEDARKQITNFAFKTITDEENLGTIARLTISNTDENSLLKKINEKAEVYDVSNLIIKFLMNYVENLEDNAKPIIDANYHTIKTAVTEKINAAMSPFAKIAFNMAGGQSIIEEVLKELLYIQLPVFLSEKKVMLSSCTENLAKAHIKDITLGKLDVKLEKIPQNLICDESIYDYFQAAKNNLIKNKEAMNTGISRLVITKQNEFELDEIIGDKQFTEYLNSSIHKIFSMPLGRLANMDELSENLLEVKNSIADSASFQAEFMKLNNDVISNFVDNNVQALSDDSKSFIIDTSIDSGIISLKENSTTLLNNIKFDEIAEQQLLEMDSKKIHTMFKSFAGKYFTRLKLYGVFGGIFGINSIAGLGLSAVYFLKNLFNRNSDK